MKLFQVLNFYQSYLDRFYQDHAELESAGYQDQIASLVADGFGACHTFAPHMARLGYDTFTAIGNNHYAQFQWLRERRLPLERQQMWMYEILKRQIDWFKPDVLYSSDPVSFDTGFLRTLEHKPALVIGFIGSPIPEGTDWSGYDVILSNAKVCLDIAKSCGAKECTWFWPGVPSFIIEEVKKEQKAYDLVFPGSWTSGHPHRNTLLQTLAEAQGLEPTFFLNHPDPLPDTVARHNRGPLWGMEMYRALKRGRIVFNAQLDFGKDEAGNMRSFEATSVGSFLLTEHHPNLSRYFEPGGEVETFRNKEELIEKARYYLAHPREREEIAERGQRRCIREHVMDRRLEELDRIIRRHLCKESGENAAGTKDLYDEAYLWGWSQEGLRGLVYDCYKTPDFADNARRFYESGEFKEALNVISGLGHPPAPSCRLLDIGCGNGIASYSLARSGYQVTAIDSSTGEVAGIRAAGKLQGLDGAQFEVRHAASARLDFPDGSFDVVWMREVLHHIKDLVPFLSEVKRVLKPGGILCCMRDVVIWNEEQRRAFFENHPFYHITHDEGCYHLDEYRTAFDNAGLVREKELDPLESVINTYPMAPVPGVVYDERVARARASGYDLFSFFARKPASEAERHAEAMLRFERLQKSKEAQLAMTAAAPPPSTANSCDDLGASFPGVSFGAMVQVLGIGNISIGDGSCIGDNSWLNVCMRDDKVRMRIGSCVLVGRQAVISTAGELEIGDYCVFAPRVYISDADHIYTDITQPIIQQGATWNRSVVVEENCWLGINTVISGSLTLGRGSVVGANAVVTRDIPPFSVVVGNPAQIVKMYSPVSGSWERTRNESDISRILEQRRTAGMPDREQYRQILRQNAEISRLDPILAGRGNLV